MSDDELLVRLVSQGDRRAFLSLYDRYASRVYGLAVRMLGESMAAEEVTQDAFLKLWSRAATFDPARGTLQTWLLTIARRTALDFIRREGRRPNLAEPEEEEAAEALPDERGDPEEARWRTMHFALGKLPREQRLVIEMAFYQGLSHSDIAQELAIPLGTVKTRLRLGMDKLRQAWLADGTSPARRSKRAAGSVVKEGRGPSR